MIFEYASGPRDALAQIHVQKYFQMYTHCAFTVFVSVLYVL